MAKFKDDNLDLLSGQYIDFDDANTVHIGHDGIELYANNTISGVRAAQPYHIVRYDQLTESSGTLQDQIDDLIIDIEGQNEFIELLDTPVTYSGFAGATLQINSEADGVNFILEPPGTVISGTTPPSNLTSLWYNNQDNIIYYYDTTRSNWLSTAIVNYLFTYGGNIDGLYMSVGNVKNSYAHFNITRPATITAVNADQDPTGSSQANKGYEIRTDGTNAYSFNMISHSFASTSLNVQIDQNDELQVYVVSLGARVRDPIVSIELKWRYQAP